MKTGGLSIVCAAFVACGARTDLGGAKASPDAGACLPAPPPATHCSGWTTHQTTTIGMAPPPGDTREIDAMLRTGCDALLAWATFDSSGGSPSVWTTAALDFGGFEVGEGPITHPGLSAQISATPALSLAQNGSRVGALESDATGCRFAALDAFGHETASVVTVGAPGCGALAAAADAFSFLRANGGGLTPVTLVKLDASGQPGGTTTLSLPTSQVFWDRLAFDDQSFLVYTFFEDTSGTYAGWLAPFDASGAALGPQITTSGVPTAPVSLVPTKIGALGAWTWGAGNVRPLDRHGAPTGPDVDVTGPATVYETLLLPAPDGDVLYAWSQLDGSSFSLHAVALAPDGTPRGPATLLEADVEDARLFGAVESSGKRALIARTTSAGVEVRSLDCLP